MAVCCLATRLRYERHIWQISFTELGNQACRCAGANDCIAVEEFGVIAYEGQDTRENGVA
jgi:hypothetical protein